MNIRVQKYHGNPILLPQLGERSFEGACVYNPAAVVKDGKVHLLYRAEEGYYDRYVSRVALAISEDGFAFERYPNNPIIDRDPAREEEKRGIEDLRLIETKQGYFLTYTAYAGLNEEGITQIKLCGALSKDLVHWEKIGTLVPGREKAGAIVQDYKYKDRYVMYLGEGVLKVAFSKNLKLWEVKEQPVLEPREGYFDDFLVEGGPPPIVMDKWILVIYNSARGGVGYEGKREFVSYAPGYALFDKDDPAKLLFRSSQPIMEPTEYWEKYAKINYVIFANGLVHFRNKWLLYYGGADKSIGVAELMLTE